MKFAIGFVFVALGLASTAGLTSENLAHASHAHDANQPCNFFPANKLKMPIRGSGHMPELTFRKIVQVVDQVYSPYFRAAGRPPLYISPRWEDDNVNAFATVCNQPDLIGTPNYPVECGKMRTSPNVITPFSLVVMFGGLARHPLMTAEGFILVACHEVGHHLGGFPRYAGNTQWASTEGQSDYFATAKCARRVFQAIGKNAEWAKKAHIDFDLRRTCQANFPNSEEDAAICMRSAMGGLSLARTLGSFRNPDVSNLTFKNVDRSTVTETFENHPAAQCRLDTYLAGALCQMSADKDFSMTDSRTGACHASRMERIGARPSCWFAEAKVAGR